MLVERIGHLGAVFSQTLCYFVFAYVLDASCIAFHTLWFGATSDFATPEYQGEMFDIQRLAISAVSFLFSLLTYQWYLRAVCSSFQTGMAGFLIHIRRKRALIQ